MSVAAFPMPMRPINGGGCELPLPLSKHYAWLLQCKFNGWRVVLDTQTGHTYNRHGNRLSIEADIKKAVDETRFWFPDKMLDVEALARRHDLGKGSLIILDDMESDMRCADRINNINENLSLLECGEIPQDDSIYGTPAYYGNEGQMLKIMQNFNEAHDCIFYEGFVAKRTDSKYENKESDWWRKFRFTHES